MNILRRAIFMLLGITLLVACVPGEEPPASLEEIESAINTAVAQTMEAEEQIAASVEMTVAAREAGPTGGSRRRRREPAR